MHNNGLYNIYHYNPLWTTVMSNLVSSYPWEKASVKLSINYQEQYVKAYNMGD